MQQDNVLERALKGAHCALERAVTPRRHALHCALGRA